MMTKSLLRKKMRIQYLGHSLEEIVRKLRTDEQQ